MMRNDAPGINLIIIDHALAPATDQYFFTST
jgi:hypothetical protein